jgi:hypothetical protein
MLVPICDEEFDAHSIPLSDDANLALSSDHVTSPSLQLVHGPINILNGKDPATSMMTSGILDPKIEGTKRKREMG